MHVGSTQYTIASVKSPTISGHAHNVTAAKRRDASPMPAASSRLSTAISPTSTAQAIVVNSAMPAMPQARWSIVRPAATSIDWTRKNSVHTNINAPWMWITGGALNVPATTGAQ